MPKLKVQRIIPESLFRSPHETFPPRCPCCSEMWYPVPLIIGGSIFHQQCYCRGICLSCGKCSKHCSCPGRLVYIGDESLPKLDELVA